MIREATLEDEDAVMRMSRFFVEDSGLSDLAPFSEVYARHVFKAMVRTKHMFILVLDVNGNLEGFCGGSVNNFIFSNIGKLGQENFFWISPEYRKGSWGSKMLQAMEDKAASLGCTLWTMISLDTQRPEAVRKLYERNGYKIVEYHFSKKLI